VDVRHVAPFLARDADRLVDRSERRAPSDDGERAVFLAQVAVWSGMSRAIPAILSARASVMRRVVVGS